MAWNSGYSNLIFTGYGGYRKGFVREIMSFFFVFLALALAWMINPYVNDFMMKKHLHMNGYRKAVSI